MKLHVLAVGERGPDWVSVAFEDYRKRFPPHCPLTLKLVPAPRRGKNPDIDRLRRREHQGLAASLPASALSVALDETGRGLTTAELARRLDGWMHEGRDVAFLIGGPDGLAPEALTAAHERWSLSPLTLPHGLVRVIVAEQLYRALSILSDHPYHRGG